MQDGPDQIPPLKGPAQRIEHFNLVDRLHTDVLEDRYGPIRVVVLHHDTDHRAAHLVDAKGISRTFAITLFPPEGHQIEIANLDAKIRAGSPIGKTFREHGYEIHKNVLDVEIIELPQWLRHAFLTDSMHAKARVCEFLARKAEEVPVVYGTVIEIYHPDFRTPEINEVDRMQESPTIHSLLEHGVSLDEVYRRIEVGAPYDRADDRYVQAHRKSCREVFLVGERIQEILNSGILPDGEQQN